MKLATAIDEQIYKLETRNEAMRNALKLVIPILGKVVADNLMPNIVQPNYPEKVLQQINDLLAATEQTSYFLLDSDTPKD